MYVGRRIYVSIYSCVWVYEPVCDYLEKVYIRAICLFRLFVELFKSQFFEHLLPLLVVFQLSDLQPL